MKTRRTAPNAVDPVLGEVTTMLFSQVPVVARNEFKATCARRGITMQNAIVKFLYNADKCLLYLNKIDYERRRRAVMLKKKPVGVDGAPLQDFGTFKA